MNERFVKFYTLTQNDYSHEKECLAVCIGGALLFDKQQRRIVGQLKFRNLSKSNIILLKVSVTAYDDNNNVVEKIKGYVYRDINVPSGAEFGGNRAIVFSNPRIRRMSVEINDVIFDTTKIRSKNNNSNKSVNTPAQASRTSEKNSVTEQKIKSDKDTNQSKYPKITKYAVVLTAIFLFSVIGLSLTFASHDNTEVFRWEDIALNGVLPSPSSQVGEIVNNSESSLLLYVYEIEESDYKTYVINCIEYGYTADRETSECSYAADNANGYRLSLYYDADNEKLQIGADIVTEAEEVTAPDTLEIPYFAETTEVEETKSDERESTVEAEPVPVVSESVEIVNTSEETEEIETSEAPAQSYIESPAELPAENTESVSSGSAVTVPTFEDTQGNLVWVPVKGGKKYHSKSSCSNMVNPMQVTVEHAVANGYTPCKRCYG